MEKERVNKIIKENTKKIKEKIDIILKHLKNKNIDIKTVLFIKKKIDDIIVFFEEKELDKEYLGG